jgi:Protein of unknown function (DUF2804)
MSLRASGGSAVGVQAVRGPAVRELGLRLPPARMAPLHRGRPLKRWRYVAVYGPELMLCVGDARVAGVPQRWWAVAFPDGTLRERTTARRLDRCRAPGWILITEPEVRIELTMDETDGVEVVSPHGGGWIWTRKRAGVPVRGRVVARGREWPIDGPLGFVDESAGYHARHTEWRWSAGIGRARGGEAVAWNLVDGVHDAPEASERTVWVDGEPHEVGAQPFAEDLSRVGELSFQEWCTREDHTRRGPFRSDYRQPFGAFSGRLPGGLELESGYGVMEWHDVRW